MGIPTNYDGLTPEMVMQVKHKSYNLVAAGTAGFTISDRDDIEAELAWHLRESLSRHDPRRSKLMSFANMVLKSKIVNMIEARKTIYFDFRDHAFSLDEQRGAGGMGDWIIEDDYMATIGARSISTLGAVELRVQVAQVMARLPEEERRLCRDILEYGSLPAVAKHTGVPRGTLYDRARKLRQAFIEAGLEK